MKKNTCGLDRVARLVVATALAALALGTSGGLRDRDEDVALWQILAMYTAGELLVTGLLQWCPGNYLLGRDTCADEEFRQISLDDSVERVEGGTSGLTERVKESIPVP